MMCDSILKLSIDEIANNQSINIEKAAGDKLYSVNLSSNVANEANATNEASNNQEEEYDDTDDENTEYSPDETEEYPKSPFERIVTLIGYDLVEEQKIEKLQHEYHMEKCYGDWHYAKMIISHAYQDRNNTEYLFDYLDKLMHKNGDFIGNVQHVYYKNDLDIDIVYEFTPDPGIHLLENLRIPAYKPHGIIFSNSEDTNKWSFKIVVVTSKSIYTANRYINDELIGCY